MPQERKIASGDKENDAETGDGIDGQHEMLESSERLPDPEIYRPFDHFPMKWDPEKQYRCDD